MLIPGHYPDVWERVFGGEIPPEARQPASVDIRLGAMLRDPHTRILRPARLLFPGEFMLGETLETVYIPPEFAGKLEGKSTKGRQGLIIHATAGWIDPGFRGVLTLEMANISKETIELRPGEYIGQLALHQMLVPVCDRHLYSGKYQDAFEVEGAKL